jgi:hypothetical protein
MKTLINPCIFSESWKEARTIRWFQGVNIQKKAPIGFHYKGIDYMESVSAE